MEGVEGNEEEASNASLVPLLALSYFPELNRITLIRQKLGRSEITFGKRFKYRFQFSGQLNLLSVPLVSGSRSTVLAFVCDPAPRVVEETASYDAFLQGFSL
ncbi:hypothetical protein LOK49_LG04G02543 [Camellia lanceoleosa]|uniref:Uncharacterized protein n=1 Tax=Camellia lanceoleosa TaxID=1840588 RepID=A0ACC0I256_9ERIC|nr:hypothetical protein LOK49_LG04G02543 [Camellia lanceoleosa]